jgi:hypothetical protein
VNIQNPTGSVMLVRRSRVLLSAGALLVFLGAAPTAASDATVLAHHSIGHAMSTGAPQARRAPQVATMPGRHRGIAATNGIHRRSNHGGATPPALAPAGLEISRGERVARLAVGVDSRGLRASNTPCRVRGPPSAS